MFEKQVDLSWDVLNEVMEFSTEKNFAVFVKDGLFYLRDVNTFLRMMVINGNEIIKMLKFKPIESPKIEDNEKIIFVVVNQKVEEMISFSKEKKCC